MIPIQNYYEQTKYKKEDEDNISNEEVSEIEDYHKASLDKVTKRKKILKKEMK